MKIWQLLSPLAPSQVQATAHMLHRQTYNMETLPSQAVVAGYGQASGDKDQ